MILFVVPAIRSHSTDFNKDYAYLQELQQLGKSKKYRIKAKHLKGNNKDEICISSKYGYMNRVTVIIVGHKTLMGLMICNYAFIVITRLIHRSSKA